MTEEQAKCDKCEDGWIYCQRCINGTPQGDRHFEQGGYVMGCAECGGYKRSLCKCSTLTPPGCETGKNQR